VSCTGIADGLVFEVPRLHFKLYSEKIYTRVIEMSDINSLDLSYNRMEEPSHINEFSQNVFEHMELPGNAFSYEKSLEDFEEEQYDDLNSSNQTPSSKLKRRSFQFLYEEDKKEFTNKLPENFTGHGSNSAKNHILPDIIPKDEASPLHDKPDVQSNQLQHKKPRKKKATVQEYKCEICGKEYKKKHNYNSHLRIHVFLKILFK